LNVPDDFPETVPLLPRNWSGATAAEFTVDGLGEALSV
jgi:hypothetical protein